MKELFPLKQVMGFAFSLVLTAVALLVYFMDMSFGVGMTILLLTAFTQAGLQLVVFMHAGETDDKKSIYVNVYYGLLLALLTILGTLLVMVWDM
ncbi:MULTISPECIES: cytochrome aa3 quinol oxidase subunit IV [Psychrobacillus]|jgi:cytochrome aa3-600 menaquinol oxidase subunit 4|uniref:Quinol oxidase subunit 4 n=1 Tax=Psychrobacillus faecigallinarum TaxID=2762235 RepID=A0ABR8RDD1_9BACI|nr:MULTISPECIES: cytochrome aa3 quinol oxidase subunit IV [Psychrobacillus]MBD7945803.1 cytochrome aa3 quinol oxidase subunit IV [Psychrobacillus faecigallinarum]QEY22475.1 cytochrome aa3 quinol oxidase subunit IV [Psychrobacillus sp. AK 1817]QGM29339.1 cytochrome aa3 quinol oxidase subunit IV [Bacillus sp. N3536]